ncbi:amidase family protein [Nonomuraea sp. NPDC026600]|uniref:amidase family protein n=1 Tax=Nonomuraea sp. NPDC026600 TaxID=3155363 RepID=UPI0033CD020E
MTSSTFNEVERALAEAHRQADLNAFISTISGDELRHDSSRPESPLAGTPIAVKDNIDVAGLPCTAGTPALRDWYPPKDALVVERLRAAGAIVIGKTNLHELAAGVTSNNPTYGPVRNPHDRNLIAGGSSGGSAAVVAAGIVDAALGTDTAGSCRIPAALCGCVGYRPTVGRYPLDGVLPLSTTRDTVGIIARDVDHVRMLDQAMTGGPKAPKPAADHLVGKRIGVPRSYFYDGVDHELGVVVNEALARLADAGATLVETEVSAVEALAAPIALPLIAFESVRDLATYLNKHRSPITAWEVVEQIAGPLESALFHMALWEEPVPHEFYQQILSAGRPALISAYRRAFEDDRLDALALPTTPLPATPIGCDENVLLNGVATPTTAAYLRNTDPSAIAGLTSISVPAGLTASGLPVGLSFDGLPGHDEVLLDLADAFERLSVGG